MKLNVQSPFNFASYRYVFVFNTTGDGIRPTATSCKPTIKAKLRAGRGFERRRPAGIQADPHPSGGQQHAAALANLNPSPVQLQFNPNSNGLGTQFTITFARALFYGYVTPSPGPGTSSPSPTPSPTPTAKPTGTSPSPSPTASASAAPYPTTQAQVNWTFNAFVYQPGAPNALDSMGSGGGTDTTFQSPQFSRRIRCSTTWSPHRSASSRPTRPPKSRE